MSDDRYGLGYAVTKTEGEPLWAALSAELLRESKELLELEALYVFDPSTRPAADVPDVYRWYDPHQLITWFDRSRDEGW